MKRIYQMISIGNVMLVLIMLPFILIGMVSWFVVDGLKRGYEVMNEIDIALRNR